MSNDTLHLIHQRRSLRAFANRPISADDYQALTEATIRAPSGGNMMYYSVVEVQDQEKKEALAVLCDNQPMIAQAPLVWVFLADCQKWVTYFKESGSVEKGIQDGIPWRAPGIGDLQLATEDAIVAAQTAVIAAESLGIGSCYIGDVIEHYEALRDLLNLPQYAAPACMLIFGYPKNEARNLPPRKRCPASSIFMKDAYQKPTLNTLQKAYEELEEELRQQNRLPFNNTGTIADYYYFRKHTSDFMQEMTRSCKAFVTRWESEEEQ